MAKGGRGLEVEIDEWRVRCQAGINSGEVKCFVRWQIF